MNNFPDFQRALKATLRYEGGKCDVPGDRGGRTAYGVTQAVFSAWCSDNRQQPRDVWTITQAEVQAIYKTRYWDFVTQGRLWPLNAMLFDIAVNSGPKNAEWMLARAKAKHPELAHLQPEAERQLKLAYAVCDVREQFYDAIVKRNPSQSKFLRGWKTRVNQQRTLCGTNPMSLALADLEPALPADDVEPAAPTHEFDAAELLGSAE